MPEPTREEIEHGISVIEESVPERSRKCYADMPIDHVCGWPVGKGKCGARVDRVTFFTDDENIDVAAYCNHHADCMTAAYEYLKTQDKKMSPEEIDALHEKLLKE